MNVIVVHNATSRLHTDPATLRAVRGFVSYRADELPSRQAQALIREFFATRRRQGFDRDVDALYADPALAQLLGEADCPPDTLTAETLHDILRRSGVWDGWTTLIARDGSFGTGLVPHVLRAVTLRIGAECRVDDARDVPPSAPSRGKRPNLYSYQAEASDALAARARGVVELPPRSGKTRIAADVITRLGLPTAYVAPGRGLVDQATRALAEFLGKDVIGVTGGSPDAATRRRMAHSLAWVMTPQTAVALDGALARTRRVLVLDEHHHAASATILAISQLYAEAYYRLGLTGTHYRADGRDMEMRSVLGTVLLRRTVGEMVDAGRLVPARIAVVRVPGERLGRTSGRDTYVGGVVAHEGRNATAAYAAHRLAETGRRVLVLVKEVRHGIELARRIPGAAFVEGAHGADAVREALAALQARRLRAVVGTSVIGEGRDVPAADALVYAAGGRSRVKVVQDFFRVLTACAEKAEGIVVDFADDHHDRLVQAAAHRVALYRAEPAFRCDVIDSWDLDRWIGV